MGWSIIGPAISLLSYCPSPSTSIPTNLTLSQPSYSLWHLETHSRRCWLMSLLVLLYKVHYPIIYVDDQKLRM